MSQTYTVRTHQEPRGAYLAAFTPRPYTHHLRCPHLMQTLQQQSLPMWMPAQS